MKYIHIDLGNIDKAYIIPISDVHLGDPLCDLDKLNRYLEWVKEKPAWLILNGDLMTCDIKNSVGDIYRTVMPPHEQRKKLIEIFRPFKDRIIGIVRGNHEYRITKEVGEDIMEVFCEILGIEQYYDPNSLLIHINIGRDKRGKKIGYTIFTTHGWAGGRRAGNKINAIQELRNIILADCYIASHTHTQGCVVERYLIPEPRIHQIREIKQTFVSAGSFLNYGDYSERRGLAIAKTGTPRIRLDGTRKDLHVSV